MAKQLNIDLSFNADTSKAKAQIMDLQRSLDQLVSSTIKNNNQLGIDKEIKQAIDDTVKLKVALQAATDINTGKLNLAKFSDSLKNGQMTLQQYAQHLKALGPEGEQAFLKLSKSIVSAETPMRQTNTLLNQMFVTLKNTAKWQISSSIIHGLQSGLASAFAYAKDLDQSLNNIRIVTGYSADEMAKFAVQANKAAQSLSTTTTQYTDAALIYYQQGIRDQEEIAGRTETTIKLANVSRQSAEEVSSQMTAIWNNFDNGSHSLEYYADVITALGANTAASSEEIANGMSKFAAVADTVGLSYEYAASSLATIVATTRQSEDTVGTGLRTIFSRLEGLKLGETLEDGVDLNKYSAALKTVGVDILDATGKLKNMDTILDETAGQWDKLDKAQKVAFATTVGGVRQYTNLIALLDHWDMMQENINTARNSEGTLNEQAEIYAQSWEAAEKRIKTAAQQIYKDLIDEKFFIKLGDFFTTALNGVDNFINAIGGIPGVIAGVGVILTTVFGKQLSESINSAMYEFSRFTGKAEDIANIQRQDALKAVNDYYNVTGASGGSNDSVASALLRQEINDSYELQKNIANLTDEQKAYSQAVLETAERYNELAINAEKANFSAATDLSSARSKLRGNLGASKAEKGNSALDIRNKGETALKEIEKYINDQFNQITNGAYKNYTDALTEADEATKDYIVAKNELLDKMNKENSSTQAIEQAQQKLDSAYNRVEQTTKELHDAESTLKQTRESLSGSSNEIIASLEKEGLITNQNKSFVLSYISALEKSNLTREDTIRKIKIAIDQQREIPEKLKKIQVGFQDIGTGAITTLKGVSQLAMGITSIKGAMDALNNTELTFFEKFSRISMGLSIGISQLAAGWPVLTAGIAKLGNGLASVIPGLSGTAIGAAAAGSGLTALAASAAIVVGAIGLVIGAVVALKTAWEKFTPEGKMAVAKKEAEKSQKALDDATKSVEEFKSAFDNWQSLYDKMSELTQGTQEYREAVLKANEAALDLINTYDLLKGTDWNLDENGNYRISEEGLNKLQTKREEILRDNYSKKIEENNTNLNVSASQTAKDLTRMSNGIGVGSQDLFNLANNYNQTSDANAIRDFGIQIGIAGTELNNFVEEVQKFASEIEENASKNEALAREIELSENRMKGPESYNSQADSLYGKYLNTYQGVNGEITKEQAEADTNNLGQLTGEKITEVYENALKSIKSDDIDDSTKQQLALALAEAQLKGSEIVDLSGIDISNLKKAIGDKYEEVFGENADVIQAAIDRSSNQIDLESFTTNFEEIHKVIDKLTDGSIIKSDDYNMLLAVNDGTSEYFAKMLDGTYKLIGDAREFYNLIHGQQIEEAKNKISQLQEENSSLSKISSHEGLSANYSFSNQNSMLYQSAWGRTSEGDEITGYKDASDTSGFNFSLVHDQLNLLSQLDQSSEMAAKIDSWKEGGYTKEEAEEIANALKEQFNVLSQLDEKQKENIQTEQELANGIAMASTSLDDLNRAAKELSQNEDINANEVYNQGLITLASQYTNTTAELKNYKDTLNEIDLAQKAYDEALLTHNANLINDTSEKLNNAKVTSDLAKQNLELSTKVGEVAKKYNLNAEEIESLAKEFNYLAKKGDIVTSITEDQESSLVNLAKAAKQTEKGLDSLNKSFDKWKKALAGDDELQKIDSLSELKDSLADVMNISDELNDTGMTLGEHFGQYLLNNMDTVEAAANGVQSAIIELQKVATEDLLIQLGYDQEADAELFAQVDNTMSLIQEKLNNGDLKLGKVDDSELLDSLTNTINALTDDVDVAQQILARMGFDAEVTDGESGEEETYWEPTTYKQGEPITTGGEAEGAGTYIPLEKEKEGEWVTVPNSKAIHGLRIKTADYVGGGNVSGSKSGTGRRSSGGKGGGGGGGKGSKAPKAKDKVEKKEKEKKRLEDEEERYHEINQELARTSHLLDLIGKEKDRAFGRNKIKNMDKENEQLKNQVANYKELKRQAEEYRKTDAANLAKYGAKINERGVIDNYTEMLAAEVDRYNAAYDAYIDAQNKAIEEYNAKLVDGMDDAAKEAAEKELEAAKDAAKVVWEAAQLYYEDFSKNVSKYEETVAKAEEAEENLQELENQLYDNSVEKITYIVELKIDVEDRDIALLQDLLEDIGDKADGACDAIANFGNQLEDTLDKVDTYTQSVSDILENAGADEDLIDRIMNNDFDEDDWEDVLNIGQDGKGLNETEIEHLKNVADALLQSNKEMRKLREEALKKTGEAFDEFNEQLSRSVGQIEHLTTVTQTYRDVLDIVGKDVLDRNGKLTDALNKQTYNIQRNHTHALQAQLDFIDTALDKAQALYDEAVENGYNQKTLESLKADVEKYEDERQATYEEWLDSWKQECQIAKDYYEDTLSQILHDFEDMVAGQFKNLSGLSEEFARKNEIADIYVDDYEKIYQLSKLNRDINNSLDDSTTLASKGKLRDIQKEINELQESGVEVSQYDLDVLRKKYEMALAYEQWQDAQNAKTVVRMQRDNEGNYGYVYTADESDVEAAEQNYEDKLHEMQVLNAEYIQSLQEQIIQAQQDCADALANLRAEDFASYEEYQDAVRQIREDYTKRIQTLSQQMNNAMDNNRTLYEEDWTAYSQATGYKISADEDYIDKFEETMYAQLTGFNTMEEAQDAFVGAMGDATDAAAENWEDWYIRTNTALDDAGLSMQNFTDEVGDRVEQLGDEAARAEDDVWNMSDEFSDAYSDISDTVANFLDEYSNYIDAMIDANRALVESINQVIAAYAELNGEENDDEDFEPDDYQWVNLKEGTGEYEWAYQSASTGKRKTGDFEADYTLEDGRKYRASYTSNESGILQASEENSEHNGYYGAKNVRELTETNKEAATALSKIANAMEKGVETVKYSGNPYPTNGTGEAPNGWYKDIASGASGMYTGSWGSSGKLAMLHEKELVLNKEDTSNILSAVDMIRSISNTIDLNALAAGAAFTGRSSATLSTFGSKESLEQNVHITAEFPSVSDHNEIEQALNSLVERAAQFAGRKKF